MEIAPVKYCPVTANNPLSCTRDGFLASCNKFRQHANGAYATKFRYANYYCRICKGTIPDNVTFFDLSEKLKEIKMGANKKFIDFCISCGEKKTVYHQFGHYACSSCMPIRSAAKAYPERVIAALQEFGNMPMAESVVDDGEFVKELERQRDTLFNSNVDLSKENEALTHEVEALKNELRSWPQDVEMPPPVDKTKIDGLAWKLAEGIIDGSVAGVALSDIRMLRDLVSAV